MGFSGTLLYTYDPAGVILIAVRTSNLVRFCNVDTTIYSKLAISECIELRLLKTGLVRRKGYGSSCVSMQKVLPSSCECTGTRNYVNTHKCALLFGVNADKSVFCIRGQGILLSKLFPFSVRQRSSTYE
jgi:hypothetical protein